MDSNERIRMLELEASAQKSLLKMCDVFFKKVLPEFDWGKSALSGESIVMLNLVPTLVSKLVNSKGFEIPPPPVDIEKVSRRICTGQFSSMSLSYNDFKSLYQDLRKVMSETAHAYDHGSFVSPEAMQLCLESNTVWTLTWYPDTPIGSYTIHGPTAESVLLFAREFTP